MLYYFAQLLADAGGPPVFTYITTRTLFGFITAFGISLLFGRRIIQFLFLQGYRDYPREDGMLSTNDKRGTPTMGGVIIALAASVSMVLWCDLSEPRVLIVAASMVIFSAIGFYDDWAKKENKAAEGGASRIAKMLPQIAFGLFLGWVAVSGKWGLFPQGFGDALVIPFVKTPIAHVSWLMLLLGVAWSGGISNAVNYTDGLDGLLSVPSFFCFLVLGVFSYIMGNSVHSEHLLYQYLDGAGELAIICSIYMGCCLGFLWFNCFPAEVFMGDFGSLMLGGVLMTIAFLLHQEIILVIAGGIFIFQFFSSFVQEIFISRFGMRLFRSAPYHEGMVKKYQTSEPKVVVRFWIIAAVLAATALITLKLR